jgi:hypothetical protein
MGDGRIFLKTRRDASFNKDLSYEPNFYRKYIIHGFTNALRKSLVSTAKCGMNLFYCHLSFFTGKKSYECCAHL